MNGLTSFLIALYVMVNLLAFLAMLWDKSRSRISGAERISEGMLFFLATMFGAVGVYAGMLLFRHKTRKWYFIIGIPALAAQNIVMLYFLASFFR